MLLLAIGFSSKMSPYTLL